MKVVSFSQLAMLPLFILFSSAFGQLHGKVSTAGGKPLSAVNIIVMKGNDSAVVRAGLTDDQGLYRLEDFGPGRYILRFSHIGYQFRDTLFTISGYPVDRIPGNGISADGMPGNKMPGTSLSLNPGILVLREERNELETVIIRAKKPLVRQETGGILVNVESSLLAKGSSALEVLERSPGVIIDHQSNGITLNGKSGHHQYRAEKNKSAGTNGSISLTGGYGRGEKATAAISLARNRKDLELYGSYVFVHDRSQNSLYVGGTQDFPPLGGRIENLTLEEEKPLQNNHDASLGLDARLHSKTRTGAGLSYNCSTTASTANDQEEFNVLPDFLLLFNGRTSGINRWRNLSANAYLDHEIRKGEKIHAGLEWLYYKNNNSSDIRSSFLDQGGNAAGTSDSLYSPHERSYRRGLCLPDNKTGTFLQSRHRVALRVRPYAYGQPGERGINRSTGARACSSPISLLQKK